MLSRTRANLPYAASFLRPLSRHLIGNTLLDTAYECEFPVRSKFALLRASHFTIKRTWFRVRVMINNQQAALVYILVAKKKTKEEYDVEGIIARSETGPYIKQLMFRYVLSILLPCVSVYYQSRPCTLPRHRTRRIVRNTVALSCVINITSFIEDVSLTMDHQHRLTDEPCASV